MIKKVTSVSFICINMLINQLMTDIGFSGLLYPQCDLFRAPNLIYPFIRSLELSRNLIVITAIAFDSSPLILFKAKTVLANVSFNLTTKPKDAFG